MENSKTVVTIGTGKEDSINMGDYSIGYLYIENAKLRYTNFAGAATQYKPAGQRTITVDIPPEYAQDIIDQGYNVKTKMPKNAGPDAEPYYQLEVHFSYWGDKRDPIIHVISNNKMVDIYEDTVGLLDKVAIIGCDLTIKPRPYKSPIGEGISAYLVEAYITKRTSAFEDKYKNLMMTSVLAEETADPSEILF